MRTTTQFKHRIVRDLAWAISSPPLVDLTAEGMKGASRSWCEQQSALFHEHLRQLDDDPNPLMEQLGPRPTPRLGKYFENLVAYWLASSQQFDLLARNVQIRNATQTLGELDFLVKNRSTGRVSHWEVAVKFYLRLGAAESLLSWHGPNKRDTLGRKITHLIEQQARRTNHPTTQDLLATKGIVVDDVFLFVKGRLFHPLAEIETPIGESQNEDVRIHPNHLRSWWCTVSEFSHFAAAKQLDWQALSKPNWLVDQTGLRIGETVTPWPQLVERCKSVPTYVVGMLGDQEMDRGFIVPDSWPI